MTGCDVTTCANQLNTCDVTHSIANIHASMHYMHVRMHAYVASMHKHIYMRACEHTRKRTHTHKPKHTRTIRILHTVHTDIPCITYIHAFAYITHIRRIKTYPQLPQTPQHLTLALQHTALARPKQFIKQDVSVWTRKGRGRAGGASREGFVAKGGAEVGGCMTEAMRKQTFACESKTTA